MPPVLVAHDEPDIYRHDLEARFPGLDLRYATSADEISAMLASCQPEVVFSVKHPGLPGPAHEPIPHCPSVRWIHVGGSGYEHLQPWDTGRITVTNSAGILSRHLAETATGAMLTLNAHFPDYSRQQSQRVWRSIPFRPLSRQTMLVVGLGAIGGWVAENAKALGMRVLAIRRTDTPHPAVDELLAPGALLDVIERADVVSLHLRLTDETRHLIDADVLAAMKPGAMLINTSRGPVVDESALVVSLQSGHIGSAYLDVFETEPLPASSPLWSMPNVIVTPHSSDNIVDWPAEFAVLFAQNLERWHNGQPLLNVVSP